jgi:sugar/nucleoside kinase (ribokinase family)
VTALDLFSIGSWTLFDHLLRTARLPREGETVALDMPDNELGTTYFGDCSANIAATASALGLRTGLGMVVGNDFESSGYRRHLSDLGVDLEGVEVRVGARSGHSYNVFDFDDHGFCLSQLGVAARQDDWQPPLALIDGSRALVVSEMFSPYTLAAIEHARRRGCLTAINGMVGSAGANAAPFLAVADILFLSRSEARDLQAAVGVSDATELLTFGPDLVVVTQGTDGSEWHARDETMRVPAVPAANFVDSTGAGDAFVAGALFGLLAGYDTITAGRAAAVVASFVIEAWGCQTNLPDITTVRQRYREHFHEELPR